MSIPNAAASYSPSNDEFRKDFLYVESSIGSVNTKLRDDKITHFSPEDMTRIEKATMKISTILAKYQLPNDLKDSFTKLKDSLTAIDKPLKDLKEIEQKFARGEETIEDHKDAQEKFTTAQTLFTTRIVKQIEDVHKQVFSQRPQETEQKVRLEVQDPEAQVRDYLDEGRAQALLAQYPKTIECIYKVFDDLRQEIFGERLKDQLVNLDAELLSEQKILSLLLLNTLYGEVTPEVFISQQSKISDLKKVNVDTLKKVILDPTNLNKEEEQILSLVNSIVARGNFKTTRINRSSHREFNVLMRAFIMPYLRGERIPSPPSDILPSDPIQAGSIQGILRTHEEVAATPHVIMLYNIYNLHIRSESLQPGTTYNDIVAWLLREETS